MPRNWNSLVVAGVIVLIALLVWVFIARRRRPDRIETMKPRRGRNRVVIEGPQNNKAWETFRKRIELAISNKQQDVFGDWNVGNWRAGVDEEDNMRYWIHKEQKTPAKILNLLRWHYKSMERLGRRLQEQNSPLAPRMNAWLKTQRDAGCSFIFLRSFDFGQGGGAAAWGYDGDKLLIFGPSWATKDCKEYGREHCIRSVIHELAHNLCNSTESCPVCPPGVLFPICRGCPSDHTGPCTSCNNHGSGFCRTNAELLLAAKDIQLYKPVATGNTYIDAWADTNMINRMKSTGHFCWDGCDPKGLWWCPPDGCFTFNVPFTNARRSSTSPSSDKGICLTEKFTLKKKKTS